MVVAFESVDGILNSDHSNETCQVVRSSGAACYAVQGGSKFRVCGQNPKMKITCSNENFWAVLSCGAV